MPMLTSYPCVPSKPGWTDTKVRLLWWLNQVEIWFSKIQRDLIARGIFESRNDLKRKIMRYIRSHNANAKPFKWTYRNAAHRITP